MFVLIGIKYNTLVHVVITHHKAFLILVGVPRDIEEFWDDEFVEKLGD